VKVKENIKRFLEKISSFFMLLHTLDLVLV